MFTGWGWKVGRGHLGNVPPKIFQKHGHKNAITKQNRGLPYISSQPKVPPQKNSKKNEFYDLPNASIIIKAYLSKKLLIPS